MQFVGLYVFAGLCEVKAAANNAAILTNTKDLRTLKDLQLFDGRIPSKEGKPRERNYFLQPTINPYLVYTVLKDNFGEPNSFDIDEDK